MSSAASPRPQRRPALGNYFTLPPQDFAVVNRDADEDDLIPPHFAGWVSALFFAIMDLMVARKDWVEFSPKELLGFIHASRCQYGLMSPSDDGEFLDLRLDQLEEMLKGLIIRDLLCPSGLGDDPRYTVTMEFVAFVVLGRSVKKISCAACITSSLHSPEERPGAHAEQASSYGCVLGDDPTGGMDVYLKPL